MQAILETGSEHTMNADPLVSIVLPTYDGARHIRYSVDSIVAQEHQNWELIVVDDGSSDDTPAIVAQMASHEKRIQVIRHDRNRNLPAALNTGHAAARGQYITWTSDDNAYKPNAIGEMAQYLDARPHIGLVYCDYSFIDEKGTVYEYRTVPEPDALPYFCCVGACFMYRRAVWESAGPYDESLFCCEDYEYWLRISQRFQMAALHKDLYLYRMHEKSLTATKKDKQLAGMRRALQMHLPNMTWAPKKSIGKGWMAVAGISLRQRQIRWFAYGLMQSFYLNPIGSLKHIWNSVTRGISIGPKDRRNAF